MLYNYIKEAKEEISMNDFIPLEVTKHVYNTYCKNDKHLSKHCPVATDKRKPIVVFCKNKVIGHMRIDKYDGEIYISDLYIYPKYRNKGFSNYFLNIATKKYKATHIAVYDTNKRAMHIYEKYGFKTFEDWTNKNGKLAHFMKLSQ